MWLTRASLRNPITVTLLCLLVLVSGAAAFLAMGRSILPPVSFPIVTVTAPYAGAGTEEMERLVVRPIEDELEGVPQLERVSSYAQAGVANIVVRFRFGSSIETDRSNVQQAVESARANMPPDLVPPVVATEDPSADSRAHRIPHLGGALAARTLRDRRSHDRTRAARRAGDRKRRRFRRSGAAVHRRSGPRCARCARAHRTRHQPFAGGRQRRASRRRASFEYG